MTEFYVTGVVIANGIPDSDGDVLSKKEIKQIFTKFTTPQTDIQHSYIRNEGVEVLGNWITDTPTTIAGKSVPAGSWLCTTKVTNEELCNLLLENKVNGYSLGSAPKSAIVPLINKAMTYKEVADIEDVQPLFISFVNKGANGYDFEVMDYNSFINKNNKRELKTMTEQNIEVPIEDEKVSIGGLKKILDIFGINKSDDTVVEAEPPVVTETPAVKDDFDKDALMEEIDNKIADGVAKGIKAFKEEEAKIEAEAKEEVEEKAEKEEKAEAEIVEVDEDQKINKEDKSTVKTEESVVPDVETNFYKMSGRDSFGCKIKK